MRLLVVAVIVLLLALVPTAFGQADETCNALDADMLDALASACAEIEAGQACNVAGDIVSLAEAETLATDDENSLLTLRIDNGDDSIQAVLFGATEITNAVGEIVEQPELETSNGVGYNINLRGGPDTTFPVVGAYEFSGSYIADGRNADGTWVRLQYNDGIAWAFIELINVDGDVQDLAILDSPYTEPMQAFSFASDSDCASGLLLQYDGDHTAALQVNDVDLTFDAGTLLLQSTPNETLEVQVIENNVEAIVADDRLTATTGESLLFSQDGLVAQSGEVDSAFSFASVEAAPVSLVSDEPLACIAGVAGDEITSFRMPESDAAESIVLTADAHYSVTGFANDEDGAAWWRVSDGQAVSWVPQAEVRTAGLCDNVVEIDPNAVVTTNTNTAPAGGGSDVLAALGDRSIWWANSGQEFSSGTCNFPPVAVCEHLVAITPTADGISWRGQEATPYTMYSAGDNFFSYSGRNKLNNANISMALTLNSTTSWTMTMTTVFDNDPECVRTFYYTASPR